MHMQHQKSAIIYSFFLINVIFLLPLKICWAGFNANYIISDFDMENTASMSEKRIASFLKAQGGALAEYTCVDLDGVNKSAAEIIYNAAQAYELSPKFILTHLQKESSLITNGSADSDLLDWAMGYGVCDGCSKDDPNVIKYKGFAKQINAAAEHIRNSYLADLIDHNYTISGWGVGITKKTLDGISVTPENMATAVLFTYTPWVGYYGGDDGVGGNSLFYDIWQAWFPSVNVLYPNGTLLQSSESGTVYLIKGFQKLPFNSQAALYANYDLNKIIVVTESVLDQYTLGESITLPEGALIRSPKGTVYIYTNGERRGIATQDVLRNLGYNPEEIMEVSWNDLKGVPEGDAITSADIYPLGALLQRKKTGAVYYIDADGVRHAIWTKKILDANFHNQLITTTSWSEIKKFSKGTPEKFKDGELLKTKVRNKYYVIAKGYKRPFASKETLLALGYKLENVIHVSKRILALHPTGKVITID